MAMSLKTTFILSLGILLVSSPLLAQGFQFEQKDHKLEIIPEYGYVWTVSRSATYNGNGGDLDLKSSPFWGVAVDINAKPGVQARLLYRRQDTQLTWKSLGTTEELGDAGVEYWHIGGIGGMTNNNVMPFTGLTLGATRYFADGVEDEWKFSIILSIGAKVYLNERIGLMVSGQMPYTFTDAFIGIGTGGLSLGGYGIAQFDVLAGLIIML
jgi:hypothetical protein